MADRPLAAQPLDAVDEDILRLLTEDARRPLSDIARRVGLSTSAVSRRVDRLERTGVIAGYTVVLDDGIAGRSLQAFTEVRFAGTANMEEIRATAAEMSEVRAVFATAGDPDALVWLEVPDVERLGRVIERLRRSGRVTGTKTLIVIGSWTRHGLRTPGRAGEPAAIPTSLQPSGNRTETAPT